MIESDLQQFLLENYPVENETCEWKEFKNLKHSIAGKKAEDIISYISALSNMGGGNLIIGVEDKTLDIKGIQEFAGFTINNIKSRIIGNCTNLDVERFNIREYVTTDTGKVIWVFNVPKHQFRLPVYAHKKAWQRIGDSLVEISQPRLDAIRYEVSKFEDWTAVIIHEASLSDLNEEAILKARQEFVKRNPKYTDDIDSWSDTKFLNKAKLTIKGKITRTALILLGNEESEHFLDSTVKIRWNLKTIDNEDKDFEIFSIPFILNLDNVYQKIRNLKYRYLRSGTLFPEEMLRYDPFSIREPLNNAIAHQDYTRKARINVVEIEDDHLIFSNYGQFLPDSVENVVLNDIPEEIYRNPFLVEAMKNLDMIETQGGGIRKMFNYQKQRLFPLPEYDLSESKVKVTIVGKIVNEDFAQILAQNDKLSLEDIVMLDKVQKQKPLTDKEIKYLRKMGFIEGRKPNIYLSGYVIAPTQDEDLKSTYIRNKSFSDDHYKKIILEYLRKWGNANRGQLEELLWKILPEVLSEKSKKNKVMHLLQNLKKEEKIKLVEGRKWETKS